MSSELTKLQERISQLEYAHLVHNDLLIDLFTLLLSKGVLSSVEMNDIIQTQQHLLSASRGDIGELVELAQSSLTEMAERLNSEHLSSS